MGVVNVNWLDRGTVSSYFHSRITLAGHIYYYIGALRPAAHIRPVLLSVLLIDCIYGAQGKHQTRNMQGLEVALEKPPYGDDASSSSICAIVQSSWGVGAGRSTPTPYRMVIHADRHPISQHPGRNNSSVCSKVSVKVLRMESAVG